MPQFPSDRSADLVAGLAPIPGGSPVSEVARRLLDLFTGGDILPGTRLPPERQLAATLEVGRSAVREALAALEIIGIVDVRPGSGTYLRGTASELLPQTLRWGLLIGERSTSDLLELRSGLEIYVARLAAGRVGAVRRGAGAVGAESPGAGGPEDALAALRDSLARMEGADGKPQAFVRADNDFHLALSAAAANTALADLLHVVRSLLHVYDDRAVQGIDAMTAAVAEHRAVLTAIEAGDEDQAASAMALHMGTASARLRDAAAGVGGAQSW
ncbi:FCD domain-containing protein [Leucobacter sp. gxy201]|uniref:FadR/GntR family transcriptional regulator n=1 Tax=Leucobacter sp. gxy201 TaxID=2957200 RepID=UPI003DA04BB7